MTEYVVLIVGDADRWWTTMDAEKRAAGYAEYTRFGEELAERGHKVTGGAELHATQGGEAHPARRWRRHRRAVRRGHRAGRRLLPGRDRRPRRPARLLPDHRGRSATAIEVRRTRVRRRTRA